MALRASWKGFLNLSLVSVSVKAYAATNASGRIRLNQLHEACHSRINLKTVCPQCGEIPRSELVKGYEYAKDQYVVIDLDELEKLRAQDDDRSIRIDTFLRPDEIDPIYFSETNYFLLPNGVAGQKPFQLLQQVMREKQVYAVAKVVLHNRDQLVLVRPLEEVLCMTVLRHTEDIKQVSTFQAELTQAEVSDAERQLAATLIDQTTTDHYDHSQYADEYTERLRQLIEAKVKGEELVSPPAAEPQSIINLMEALKASVSQLQRGRGAASKEAASSSGPGRKKLADELAHPKPKKASKRKKRSG